MYKTQSEWGERNDRTGGGGAVLQAVLKRVTLQGCSPSQGNTSAEARAGTVLLPRSLSLPKIKTAFASPGLVYCEEMQHIICRLNFKNHMVWWGIQFPAA